jgi:nesprin-1
MPNNLNDVSSRLGVVKSLQQTLEQGQNRLRYALELKEKVILNTEQNGAAKIQEDSESLKQEFDKLVVDVQVIFFFSSFIPFTQKASSRV